MTQTNEELREKAKQIILSFQRRGKLQDGYIEQYTNEIMSLIPQPEQLECEIEDCLLPDPYRNGKAILMRQLIYYFENKQEALDFCKRFNLKVVNEESK